MVLGIDLGTSALKLLLLDDDHAVRAVIGEPLALSHPQPRHSEQSPRDWWTAFERAMGRLREAEPTALAAVRAIGLSGQMHGAVLLDGHDEVLRPAILWNDGRSGRECAELEADLPALREVTGNLAMPGFTAPKLRWLQRHEPALHARIARVLLPKDWLRLRLTGEAATDCSDASGTLWLDVGRRDWWDEGLAACGLTRRQMPRLVEGPEVAGTLRPALAERFGLRPGLPVAGGGGDNAASAVGIGAVQAGQGFVSLGSSGVVFVTGERFEPRPAQGVHAFCHALPGRWHQMAVILSAGSALRWACRLLGGVTEQDLVAQAAALSPARQDRAPLFLPYLAGERTPHNDPAAQGVLFGLSAEHGPADVGHAVLEGVTLALRDGWQALGRAPDEVAGLSLVGGGARSAHWAQMLASAIDRPVHTHDSGDAGAALGAARLARLADGAAEAEVCRVPPIQRRFAPDPDQAARLAARATRFRRLYPLLRESFAAAP